MQDDHLTVQLTDVPWRIVLQELQRQTGLTFRVEGSLEGTVTEAFEVLPLEKGLRRLIRNANLVFLYRQEGEGQGSRSRLAQVWILPRLTGSPAERIQTPQQPSQRADDPLGSLIHQALAAEQEDERERAVEALAESKDPRVREVLIQALQDPDHDVRGSAVDALANVKDEAAIDHLSQTLLQDVSKDVRESAADALGTIGGERAIEALKKALQDEDEDVREAAEFALRRLAGKKASD